MTLRITSPAHRRPPQYHHQFLECYAPLADDHTADRGGRHSGIIRIYDNRDWLYSLDPLQAATLYTNDLAGWLVSQTDPVQRTTTFGFDADGRQIAATNAAQEVTQQSWDARGKHIALTDGAQHTSLRAYDGVGNQIILTNRNRKVWQFQFDGANRLTNTITPLLRHISQGWNHQGLLSS